MVKYVKTMTGILLGLLVLCAGLVSVSGTASYGCSSRCSKSWNPVCSYYDHTFANECVARCRGEHVKCDGVCPCAGKPPYPAPYPPYPPYYPPRYPPYPYPPPHYPDAPSYPDRPSSECRCGMEYKYDPVCSASGEEFDHKCLAICEGQYIACESKCPCT